MVRAKTKADTTMETVYKLIEILDTITSIPDSIPTNKIAKELAALTKLVDTPSILEPLKTRFTTFGRQLEQLRGADNDETNKDFAYMFISLSKFNRKLLVLLETESKKVKDMEIFILERFPRLLALVDHLVIDEDTYVALRGMYAEDATRTKPSLYDRWTAISIGIEARVNESLSDL